MSISHSTTEKVKERADIEDVVNDYVPLKKKGQNLWACCPFHNEKSPSFSVSPAKQIYKCFGCGKAGDPIQFVMDVEGIGFNEAIRHLAKKYGIEIEEDKATTPEDIQAFNERESLYIALNFAKNLFVENLKSDEGRSIGLSYFKERGFTQEIIEKFDLGYALDSWDHMLKSGKKAGHSEEILLKAGLVLQKDDDKARIYDRFRNRVIFTIHNLGGKPIAFGARILTQDKKQPKYINSPETEVYHKSDVLYGLFQAKQAMRQADNCYLVEGYTDVISLHLAGIQNVVASSGTSLTEGQIKLIKRFTDNVTVLYDGDAAGIKASLRGIDMLLEGGLNVKAVVFPDGDDPDSYSRKVGGEIFQDYLKNNARDFIEFKIDLYAKESEGDPIKRAEVIRQVVQSISKIPDPIIRTVYVKESGRLLSIEEDIVLAELNKILLKGEKDAAFKAQREQEANAADIPFEDLLPVAKPEVPAKEILAAQEGETLRLLISYGFEKVSDDLHVCEYLLQEIADLSFETPVYQKILVRYKQALAKGELPTAEYFLNTPDAEAKSIIVNMISPKHELSESWEKKHQIFTARERDNLPKTIYDGVLRLKRNVLKKMIDETKLKIKTAGDDELLELLGVYQELKRYQAEIDKHFGTVISN
ncbi:DNA primase [Litoribacter ruber]|uniref:DNA primase n=1 Tax=Litoribacter ruber TaxID=702568 RepID=A0AAP2CGK5_9BACT|nr:MULTISPECIES: DNA primase [Litoribacter]MBS9523239.1 DNA primase [Litoribacter alkaliphilus]MBT0810598.1 DNA primase [Litoribacter ruber]